MKDEYSLEQRGLFWFELCQPFTVAWLFCGIQQKQSPRHAVFMEFVLSKVGMGPSSCLTIILFVCVVFLNKVSQSEIACSKESPDAWLICTVCEV